MLKGSRIFKYHFQIVYRGHCLIRLKHSSEGNFKLRSTVQTSSKSGFHKAQGSDYPTPKKLPLPLNIEDLAYFEKLKFSPQRNRDINGSYISSFNFEDSQPDKKYSTDIRVECYDCSGTVNLSSAMQTNVPFPFVSKGKPVHLNMPGGQWGQKEKYVSEELRNVHHFYTSQPEFIKGINFAFGNKLGAKKFFFTNSDLKFHNSLESHFIPVQICQVRNFCTVKDKVEAVEENLNKSNNKIKVPQLSQKEKLKAAIKDYGAVVLVFHIIISLLSLGCCYAVVASGVDLPYIFKEFGKDDGATAAGTAANFVIAYAVHKSLAPGRIALTLATVPFIVKKLRKVGILKTPKPKLQ